MVAVTGPNHKIAEVGKVIAVAIIGKAAPVAPAAQAFVKMILWQTAGN